MIDGCECLVCVCSRPTRGRDGVFECSACRHGKHRRERREAETFEPRRDVDPEVNARIVARVEAMLRGD